MIPDPNQTTVSAVAQNEMRFCAREGDGDRLLSERNPVERAYRCANERDCQRFAPNGCCREANLRISGEVIRRFALR